VAKLMRHYDVGSVAVVEDGSLVGIIPDRDIALRVVAEERDPHMTYAGEIATADPRAAGRESRSRRRRGGWRPGACGACRWSAVGDSSECLPTPTSSAN
jgi:hypothetical protein